MQVLKERGRQRGWEQVSVGGPGQGTKSLSYRQLIITAYHAPSEFLLSSGKSWLCPECARASLASVSQYTYSPRATWPPNHSDEVTRPRDRSAQAQISPASCGTSGAEVNESKPGTKSIHLCSVHTGSSRTVCRLGVGRPSQPCSMLKIQAPTVSPTARILMLQVHIGRWQERDPGVWSGK